MSEQFFTAKIMVWETNGMIIYIYIYISLKIIRNHQQVFRSFDLQSLRECTNEMFNS